MAIWAFKPGPGAHIAAVWCDDEREYDDFAARARAGTLTVDDNRVANLDAASSREALFLRVTLAGPYVPPPLVLHFEDIAVATRIGETGWYTFEGGLYRATDLGGGRIVLDRVYEGEPPPQWHGQALSGHGTLEHRPRQTLDSPE